MPLTANSFLTKFSDTGKRHPGSEWCWPRMFLILRGKEVLWLHTAAGHPGKTQRRSKLRTRAGWRSRWCGSADPGVLSEAGWGTVRADRRGCWHCGWATYTPDLRGRRGREGGEFHGRSIPGSCSFFLIVDDLMEDDFFGSDVAVICGTAHNSIFICPTFLKIHWLFSCCLLIHLHRIDQIPSIAKWESLKIVK